LASKILEDNEFGKLGFYSVGIIYVFFAAFSFPAASLVEKWGEKRTMTIGGLCYVFYCAAFILPLKRTEQPENETLQGMYWHIYFSLIFGAVMVGFGASILWVA